MITCDLAALSAAQYLNLAFAALCLWTACGLGPRQTAVFSAILYIAFAVLG